MRRGTTSCGNFGSPISSRREFLQRSGMGFGAIALTALLADEGLLSAAEDLSARPPRLGAPASAKRVILLFMGGGPSHVDTWDPKPVLTKLNGQDVPPSLAANVPRIARSRLNNL